MRFVLLPVLTVRQPWASLIAHGWKDVENRTWTTRHRGPLVVHAGRRHDPAGDAHAARVGLQLEALPYGVCVAVVELHDVVRDSPSVWAFPGHWHWLLRGARLLRLPVPMRGTTLLREAPPDVAEAVRRAGGTRSCG